MKKKNKMNWEFERYERSVASCNECVSSLWETRQHDYTKRQTDKNRKALAQIKRENKHIRRQRPQWKKNKQHWTRKISFTKLTNVCTDFSNENKKTMRDLEIHKM